MNTPPQNKPSLQKNLALAKAVFERLSDRLERSCEQIVGELAAEGYDLGEVAWVLGQVMLASSLAVHMQGGIDLELLVQQIRHNWKANAARMGAPSSAAPPAGPGPNGVG